MRPTKLLPAVALVALLHPGFSSPAGAADTLLAPIDSSLTESSLVSGTQTDTSLRSLLAYRAGDGLVALDGAAERNIPDYLAVAFQRSALWLLERGIVERRETYVDATVRAMEYAFRKQTPDGYFANALGVPPANGVESDSFFMQSFARTYLIVGATSYRDRYLPRLDALQPQAARAMAWLSANRSALVAAAQSAPNRLLFDAAAFILNARVLGDPSLLPTGYDFVRRGLAMQLADGSFVEGGGYDSSYQATSLGLLAVIIPFIADPEVQALVKSALWSGLAWEKTRILPTGEVLVDGNARTGMGQESLLGKPKEVNYAEVAFALIFAGKALPDPEAAQLGGWVINYVRTR